MDSLCPYLIRLTHGYPYIGADYVSAPGALFHVLGQGDGTAGYSASYVIYELRGSVRFM